MVLEGKFGSRNMENCAIYTILAQEKLEINEKLTETLVYVIARNVIMQIRSGNAEN